MGGSSKGGGGSSGASYDYFGTILIGLGEGPLDALVSIIEDGKEIYHGPLLRSGATTPALITIPDRGKLRLYWGTPDQPVSSLLNGFEPHGNYRDRAYIVGEDFLFGRERSNCPNWEFVVRRAARQTLITGTPAQLDSAAQVNLVAFAAEVLTSPSGLGLANARLNAASWQAVANALDTADLRSLLACSPLLTDQSTVRSLFQAWGEIAQIWARRDAAGLIELGRWSPPADPGTVPLIAAADLAEDLEFDTAEMDKLPTDYSIEFTDGSRLHKKSSERVPDLAAGRLSVEPIAENLTHPEITRRDQARRVIAEYMRLRRGGSLTGTAQVRRAKALGIKPGDYFRLDIDTIPGGAGLAQLVRCVGRSFGPTGPIGLEFESEPASAPVSYVAAQAPPAEAAAVLGPLYGRRLISLPPTVDGPVISCLAARPGDDVTGLEVLYDDDPVNGTFGGIGYLSGWALPVKLAQAAAAAAATVRVNTFAEFSAGHRADRERWLLSDGAGATGSEARNDTLLLVLLKKDPGTGAILANGGLHYLEVLAISGISLVAADTWDLSVLRGRLGTTALDFNGGSFPDAWSQYEGWVIPHASLAEFTHGDFASLLAGAQPGYFRFRPYSRLASYDPQLAFEAGLQPTADWATDAFTFPAFTLRSAGNFFDYVFRRAASRPATPTGDGTPSGWYDAPPDADGTTLWMSSAEKTASNTLVGSWSLPVPLDAASSSATGIVVEYSTDGATRWHGTFGTGDLYMRQRLGRNLVRNSSFWNTNAPSCPAGFNVYNNSFATEPTTQDYLTGRTTGSAWRIAWSVNNTSTKGFYFDSTYDTNNQYLWHSGQWYTLSVYAYATGTNLGKTLELTWNHPPDNCIALENPPLTGNWQRYVFKFRWNPGSTTDANGFVTINYASGTQGTLVFADVQVELGEVATDYDNTWSPPIRVVGEQGPIGPQGNQGIQGPAGNNGQTTYFHVAYANSADGQTGFNQTSGLYIGTYVDFTAADSNNPASYTWRQFVGSQGPQGNQGIPGTNGSNGQTSYLHIKYSNDGGATFTGNGGEDVGLYIGTYVDFTATDSSSVSAYQWARIKGDTGAQGPAGSNAPLVQWQYSTDGSSWHSTCGTNDLYFRNSNDGGSTWSAAMQFRGGATAAMAPVLSKGNAYVIYVDYPASHPAGWGVYFSQGGGAVNGPNFACPFQVNMTNGTQHLQIWATAPGLTMSDIQDVWWNDM